MDLKFNGGKYVLAVGGELCSQPAHDRCFARQQCQMQLLEMGNVEKPFWGFSGFQ